MKRKSLPRVAAAIVSMIIGTAGTDTVTAQERHRFPISVANPAPPDAARNGPIFQKVDAITSETTRMNGPSFASFLAPDAKLSLWPKKLDITGNDEIGRVMQIIMRNCQGPYSIDEGQTWAQTSWVCHVGKNEPVREYFPFENSPELDLEFRFEGTRIKKISAMELLWLPNRVMLPMDAAEHVPDKR